MSDSNPLRVLITNNRLDLRGGSEVFVRDLARELQRRGHTVIAYSSDLRESARMTELDPIPVASDIAEMTMRPDIIHGQHHLDAMTALFSLPGVPAIYHCHGAVWQETQPVHPRIHRYVAMSEFLARRIALESNVAADRIEVLPNAVDLRRFNRVRSPMQPCRIALFFNGHHSPDSPVVKEAREAARRCGLAFDTIGRPFGTWTDSPETTLPDYDIVFASGKSAIDALACGCAVIVLGRSGCGELVRPDNYERLRAANFSLPSDSDPPRADAIEAELRRYAPDDVSTVTQRLREDADFVRYVDRLESIYRRTIAEQAASPPESGAEWKAAGRYLRTLVPMIKQLDDMRRQLPPPRDAEHWNQTQQLRQQMEQTESRIDFLQEKRREQHHRVQEARDEVKKLKQAIREQQKRPGFWRRVFGRRTD